jgi:D-serine deaminase-like pyridoxal phosphate-dependent protein
LYAPGLFDHFRQFHNPPALCFALQVVRKPKPGIVTCLGGGYVASGPAGVDRLPRPYLPVGMRLIAQEGAGEVQTPVLLPPGVNVEIGDPLFFRHAKAGELAERFASLLLVSGDQIVGEAATYRGEQQCFL